jgi:hypothetical protein
MNSKDISELEKRLLAGITKENEPPPKKVYPSCVICGGELVQDLWFRPFDMHTPIGGPAEKGKPDGYHCELCGVKYKKLPTKYWEKQKAQDEFMEGLNYDVKNS